MNDRKTLQTTGRQQGQKTRDRVNGPHTVNGKQLQKNYKLAVNKIGKNKHKKGLTSFNGLTKSS